MLRFFAFFCVLIHHGPDIVAQPGWPRWEEIAARLFSMGRVAGGFGMCMFFLLSAYLITELLMKEQSRTASVHIKAFYLRRILRIWPLYFGALIAAEVIGCFVHDYHISPIRLLSFVFLGANLLIVVKGQVITFVAHLWSISVEEQFYLLWPSLAKAGGAKLLRNVSLVLLPVAVGTAFWLALHNPDPFSIWVNSFVQFLFFAIGALLSLSLNGRTWKAAAISRIVMFGFGLCLWMVAVRIGFQDSFPATVNAAREAGGYVLSALGCVSIFLACLQMPEGWARKRIIYLGKISYGLYVFHFGVLLCAYRYASPHRNQWLQMIITDGAVLAVTVLLSAVSYRYFETPFLVLKQRFEFVRSRPA